VKLGGEISQKRNNKMYAGEAMANYEVIKPTNR